MRGARSAKWVAGAIVVAMAATACGGDSGDDKKSASGKPEGYVSIEVGEPQNAPLPSDTNESNGSYIVKALFTQLLEFDDKGEIVYLNAESVETEDSKTWTVKLKDGWTFHNGEKVTAQSYVDTWNFAANVKNNQKNSFWFSDIKGYEDVHPEKGDPKAEEMSGLKVVDDLTFTVELSEPVPYFEYKLGYTTWAPLPSVAFDDPKKFGEKPIGNGPYKFEKWNHNKLFQVAKYDKYKGEDSAKNEGIQFKNYSTPEAAYQELLSGNVDMVRQIGAKDLPKYKQDLGDRAIEQPYAAVQSIVPAFYSKPFKDVDPKVLQGLSMAIDRETIAKTVMNGTREAATSFTPPQVQGNQDLDIPSLKFDAKKAKELVEEGGGVPGNKIWIQFNADGGHKEWVTAVCENIRQNTGVECIPDSKPDFQTDLDLRDANKVKGMYRGGWVADYPLNVNFMRELYHSKAEANSGRFNNKEIDALMEKGDHAKTLEESIKLYQEAEQVMAEEMPAFPIFNYKINAGYGEDVENVNVDWHGDLVVSEVTTK
ncbi:MULTISPECIES: ABC transporter substrate-binding protein [Streptomyces]|uniref:ABC transporter substrate-binding protein n=1 Tax=Streptomyces lycii TaxID=2654337 RepID=A0ABQ7F8X3_9ACTN|nr:MULTISPECIES: ABC transporter substrate-binding protein [Streptomyces]KAF4405030.1 ABC transporter substrate-binding protein [Streptomyces lycii]PGH48397.1 peptide ABC transporter substrate-binding protein [Streptomyces sp. Ru87]